MTDKTGGRNLNDKSTVLTGIEVTPVGSETKARPRAVAMTTVTVLIVIDVVDRVEDRVNLDVGTTKCQATVSGLTMVVDRRMITP